jgi:hypothetical protein
MYLRPTPQPQPPPLPLRPFPPPLPLLLFHLSTRRRSPFWFLKTCVFQSHALCLPCLPSAASRPCSPTLFQRPQTTCGHSLCSWRASYVSRSGCSFPPSISSPPVIIPLFPRKHVPRSHVCVTPCACAIYPEFATKTRAGGGSPSRLLRYATWPSSCLCVGGLFILVQYVVGGLFILVQFVTFCQALLLGVVAQQPLPQLEKCTVCFWFYF